MVDLSFPLKIGSFADAARRSVEHGLNTHRRHRQLGGFHDTHGMRHQVCALWRWPSPSVGEVGRGTTDTTLCTDYMIDDLAMIGLPHSVWSIVSVGGLSTGATTKTQAEVNVRSRPLVPMNRLTKTQSLFIRNTSIRRTSGYDIANFVSACDVTSTIISTTCTRSGATWRSSSGNKEHGVKLLRHKFIIKDWC